LPLVSAAVSEAPQALDDTSFSALQALIRPQEDESQWAKVPWLTSLKDARERAVAEDKPLIVWRSGGGDVLGRT
jgi:hypothetical protein